MDAFSKSCARNFEQRMVRHLEARFPARCAAMDSSSLLLLVQKGIERAASHGITAEIDVCQFVELTCTLGEEFDEDPSLPWATEILGRAGPDKASERVEKLSAAASHHLAQTQPESMEGASQREISETRLTGTKGQFSSRTYVGQPVAPCPKPAKKRILVFSA